MAVYISDNLKKESKVFDINGNEIDLKTKKIIKFKKDLERNKITERLSKLEEKIKKNFN